MNLPLMPIEFIQKELHFVSIRNRCNCERQFMNGHSVCFGNASPIKSSHLNLTLSDLSDIESAIRLKYVLEYVVLY